LPTRDDKMHEMLCRMMPNLANQLRGPMGNMYAALQRVLERPVEDGDKQDVNLSMLYQSYYRMLRLTGNLSDAPSLLSEEPLRLANEDIVALVQNICRQAEAPAELCGQRLIFESEKVYHIIAVNAEGIERMMLNLLSNAMKFTGKGGVITVAVRVDRDRVELSVEDTGPGIAPADQEILFERYQQPELMDPTPYGLGLGLPLCRRIARGHGGTILLSSVLHAGTKVVVSLPNRRLDHTQLRELVFDYAGGFNHVLVELSDALPAAAFREKHRGG